MSRKNKRPASTSAASTPPTLTPVKKGGHGKRVKSVRGARIYGEEGAKVARIRNARRIHANHVENRANNVTKGRHEFRYLCYIRGCAWGVNSGPSEASPHFRSGAHPGKVYDVNKVIKIAWDEWLNDTDLLVTAKATSTKDWYRRFDAKLNGVKEEDIEDDEDEEMEEQADDNGMEIEQEDCKQEDD